MTGFGAPAGPFATPAALITGFNVGPGAEGRRVRDSSNQRYQIAASSTTSSLMTHSSTSFLSVAGVLSGDGVGYAFRGTLFSVLSQPDTSLATLFLESLSLHRRRGRL